MFSVAEVEIPGNACASKKWKHVYTERIDALYKLRDEILFQRSLSSASNTGELPFLRDKHSRDSLCRKSRTVTYIGLCWCVMNYALHFSLFKAFAFHRTCTVSLIVGL